MIADFMNAFMGPQSSENIRKEICEQEEKVFSRPLNVRLFPSRPSLAILDYQCGYWE